MARLSESFQDKKTIFFDIGETVPSFTGRQRELDEISSYLKQGTVVITGVAGVGKSVLAIEYAHRRHGTENSVIWINTETRETANDSFRRLLKEIRLKTNEQDNGKKSVGTMAKEVYEHFAGKRSLLIFDSAEEHSILKEFLPINISDFTVLITTENTEFFNEQEFRNIKQIYLEILPLNEGIEFVKNALSINDSLQDQDIQELVNLLGRLPLALQLAVAYIKESGYAKSIDKCVRIYKRSDKEIQLYLNQEGCSDCNKVILLTLKIALAKIKNVDLDVGYLAEEILNILAYFASNNIPTDLLLLLAHARVEESHDSLEENEANRLLMQALTVLVKYSIVKSHGGNLSIHGLLQEVLRSELKKRSTDRSILEAEEEYEEEVLVKALRILKRYSEGSPENKERCLPHTMSVWNYASMFDDPDIRNARDSIFNIILLAERCLKHLALDVIELYAENIETVN